MHEHKEEYDFSKFKDEFKGTAVQITVVKKVFHFEM